MRKLLSATIAAAAVAGGGLAVADAAKAQPYGYYSAPPASGYYDSYGRWHAYSQPSYGYNQRYSTYGQPYAAQPYYAPNGYYGNDGLSSGLAVLGSVLGLNTGAYGSANVPVDRYGPDPNGMIAPDGHRIKCKLRSSYDSYYGRSMTRRECW